MSTDYNYDEQGQFFPFFVLTITGIVTLPLTYSALKPSKGVENTAPRIQSGFQPQDELLINRQRRKQKRRERKVRRMLTAAGGWLVMGFMVYLIMVTARTTTKVWDPYSILGLSTSASEKQIKKHYKMLSLTEHPDKRRPDEERNVTIETINDEWVEVTKAFKALTDEEVRNNYIQYGHPDGKQSFSIGIALPQFIVSEGNGRYVLLLYAAFLGIILPYLVGTWWYGTQRKTKEGVLTESAGKLFTEYDEDIQESEVIGALSAGLEYQEESPEILKGKDSSSAIERRVFEAPATNSLSKKNRDLISSLDDEQRRKSLSLLWAYLHRIPLEDQNLDEQKYAGALIAFSLNESFASIALAYSNVKPLLASYHASQSLVQAVPPGASPLMQLPHFTPTVINALASTAPADSTSSLQAFMSLPDYKRRELLLGPGFSTQGLMTPAQYATAMRVASQIPLPVVERAFFKVVGESHCPPSSFINLIIKLRIIPPGTPHHSIPPLNPKDLEEPDPKEGDVPELRKRMKALDPSSTDGKIQPPLAHAPFFARDHSPRWRVFLSEARVGKVAVPPSTFTSFENPLFEPHATLQIPQTPATPAFNTASKRRMSLSFPPGTPGLETTEIDLPTPTFAVQTLRMGFVAPPHAGEYSFTMHLVCDSYVGIDLEYPVVMKVEEIGEEQLRKEEEESKRIRRREAEEEGEDDGVSRRKDGDWAAGGDSEDEESEESSDGDSSDTDTDTETDTDEE
ncbi:MAG: secretory subunit [Chrysothrix sp. TS-e1954]|nr:MAG: secretory subunit [Chrysothrix sp. TS-e1954]